MDNPCFNYEEKVDVDDIKAAEKNLNYSFPDEFVSHYLSFNGGEPLKGWWKIDDDFEPLEIAGFKPFKYNQETGDDPKSLIDGCYHEMVKKGVIPLNIIPFANDWGGNFFCLNKHDDSIVFYATDSFDPDIPMNENHKLVQKKIASSFKYFIENLVEESEL